uniref:hypothetical protein n=1 Tax=uncultured Rhizobium sp. TaxID=155567 RepID=UPI0026368D94|nr:hypothetical protein [uncultured Rhizobium sp.]
MNVGIKCIAALSILASPCAWVSASHEAPDVFAMQEKEQREHTIAAEASDHSRASSDIAFIHDDVGFEMAFQ